jgi:Subtilase family/Secretion system C-terminal sorting domain/CUB domain/Fibronectin type III domain
MKTKITLLFFFIFSILAFGQTEADRQKIIAATNTAELNKMATKFEAIFRAKKAIANQMASIKGWPLITKEKNGGMSELIRLDKFGNPVYYQTDNAGAAITTRANKLNSGGSLGLSLDGQNMNIGVWDGGKVLNTHLLLTGRVTQVDNSSTLSDHATHVSGTMMGNATASVASKGMASQANLKAYDWGNDNGEVATAAANGLLISNHSYGNGPQNVPVPNWGKYDEDARSFDEIMFNAPYYQFVNSAGNSRNAGWNPTKSGYDLLSGKSTSKNGIIVAAVSQVTNYTSASSVSMSSFSSWGPTDDGRIKPDICGKGVNVRSSISTSNNAYDYYDGTSMASPNVAGTLLLLQQHYNNVKGSYMRAATLRGLAIHTADEAGSALGPDYRFGWGLLNAEKAANLITNEGTTSRIKERTLLQGNSYSFNVQPNSSTQALTSSICWTDPAGDPITSDAIDVPTPNLVNDLDIRVIKNTTPNFPWKLNPAAVTAAATKGDNIVDNIEKIEVLNPSETYTVTISHKKTLTNGLQNYSLIMSNIINSQILLSTNNSLTNRICEGIASTQFDFQMETVPSFNQTANFSVTGLPSGVIANFSSPTLNSASNNSIILSNLNSVLSGTYQIIVTATSSSATSNIFFNLIIQNSLVASPLLNVPINNATATSVNPLLTWENIGNNITNYVIEIAKDNSFSTSLQSYISTTNQLNVSNLDFGTNYFWRVKAINTCGESSFSATNNFSTSCSNNLVITITNPSINGATATWTNPNAASNFEIEVVPQGTTPTGIYTSVATNTYTFNTLNSNTNYIIYLRSSCSGNTFSSAVTKTFRTLTNHCVDGVYFDSGGSTSNYLNNEYSTTTISPVNPLDKVTVSFSTFNLEDQMDFLYALDGPDENSPLIGIYSGTISPGSITSTHTTGKLTFLFSSDAANTASGWNATVTCANLGTISTNNKLFIYYPNPATNSVTFSGFETIKSIGAYSMIGQLLKTENINAKENTFDISDFPAGNYLFKVETENGTKTVKIMKQ